MTKISDIIARNLKKITDTVFGITGGAIVNIFDSLDKYRFNIITPNHEQSAAMMADAFSRIRYDKNEMGIVVVTSGPGVTNLLTGTACSYFDSIPILNIAGQVPSNHLKTNAVRQYGFQEIDAVSIIRPITKFSSQISSPDLVKPTFEDALHEAVSNRPGPVFIDICDDVQRAILDDFDFTVSTTRPPLVNKNDLQKIEECLTKAKRPVFIFGNGIRLNKCEKIATLLAHKWNIPTVLTWAILDILDDTDPINLRDFGVTAQRAANFVIQEADLLICFGTRLDTHETGENFKTFAPKATKIIIDIDQNELKKFDGCICIKSSVDFVINELLFLEFDFSEWLSKATKLRQQYPICLPSYYNSETLNPYVFLNILSMNAAANSVIISDAGCTVAWTMQGWKVKKGQRLFSAFNNSPMGYSLPASIGAYYADNNRPIICIIGDGGFQMNLQELALLQKTNVKVFVLDNEGYGMIRQTQDLWLNSNYVATSGPFCDIKQIAWAYNIKYSNILNIQDFTQIPTILNYDGPAITNIKLHKNELIQPKLLYGNSIENSSPLLDQIEIKKIKEALYA